MKKIIGGLALVALLSCSNVWAMEEENTNTSTNNQQEQNPKHIKKVTFYVPFWSRPEVKVGLVLGGLFCITHFVNALRMLQNNKSGIDMIRYSIHAAGTFWGTYKAFSLLLSSKKKSNDPGFAENIDVLGGTALIAAGADLFGQAIFSSMPFMSQIPAPVLMVGGLAECAFGIEQHRKANSRK